MNILTRNGRALVTSGGVLATLPRYRKLWGYYQATHTVTAEPHDWAGIYEWIYGCLSDGLSAGYRRITVGETTYVFPSDGGDAPLLNVTELRRIVIPLIQFQISNNENNRAIVKRTMTQLVRENHELILYVSGFEVNTINGTPMTGQPDFGGKIGYVTIRIPNDELRKTWQRSLASAVASVTAKVYEVTGYTAADAGTWRISDWQKRRDVVKVIHDWLLVQTRYPKADDPEEIAGSKYWGQLACTAMVLDPAHYPVCTAFAGALAYVCNLYSINAIVVSGDAGVSPDGEIGTGSENHAWAILSLTAGFGDFPEDAVSWTAIDETWDNDKYHKIYSPDEYYSWPRQCIYEGALYVCISDEPVKGVLPTDSTYYALVADADHYDPGFWANMMTSRVYYKNGVDEPQTRTNGRNGYPVQVPVYYCPYYGKGENDLYDVTKWIPGGDAQ